MQSAGAEAAPALLAVRARYALLPELLLELSCRQWCVVDEPPLDEPALLLALGVGVAFVAAKACPTPTPPRSAPAASVDAKTACRIFGVTSRITSLPSRQDARCAAG